LPFEVPAVIAHEWGAPRRSRTRVGRFVLRLVVCLRGGEAARYSAWLEIFSRTLSARDRDDRRAVRARLPDAVRADLQAMAERSERDQVRAVSVMAWRNVRHVPLRSAAGREAVVRNFGSREAAVGTRFDCRMEARPAARS